MGRLRLAESHSGVRYTQDEKGLAQRNDQPLNPRFAQEFNAGRRVFDAWTPMASVAITLRAGDPLSAQRRYDFLDRRVHMTLWGRNLLDETIQDFSFSAVSTFGTVLSWYAAPRTYGVTVGVKF